MAPPVDTAEPPAVTAVEPLSAPETEPEAAPETTPEEQPTTVASPEAEAAESEPEGPTAGDLAELIAALPEEERRNLGPIKDLLAREGESVRRKTEHEAHTQLSTARERWAVSGQATQDLVDIALDASENPDERGRPKINLDKLNTFVGSMADAVSAGATYRAGRAMFDGLTADQEREMQEEVRRTPVAGLPALAREWYASAVVKTLEKERGSLRRQVESEVKKDYEARAKNAQAKAAEAQRKAQPQPSRAGAAQTASSFTTKAEVDAAHADGRMTTAAYRAERYSPRWANLPEF